MAISFRSKNFQDTLGEITEEAKEGNLELNKESITKYIQEKDKGFSAADFFDANSKYRQFLEEGGEDERARAFSSKISPALGSVERAARRGVGDIARGAVQFGDMILPENIKSVVEETAEKAGEYIPESVKELSSEWFDPYHGEGLVAGGEEIAGVIGSFIVPGQGIIKGANLTTKGVKALSPGSRAVLTKTAKNLGRRKRKISKSAGRGTAFAAGATIVAPEDNVADILVQEFPESTQFLERLAVDENDTEAKKAIKTFMANLGIGAAFAPVAVAAAYKKPIIEGVGAVTQPIRVAGEKTKRFIGDKTPASFSSALAGFSSRGGADDTILELNVRRAAAGKESMIRAEGLALDLQEAIKKEYGSSAKTDKVIDAVNKGLESRAAANKLKPKTKELVNEMRTNIDSLSKELGESAKKGSKIKGTINKNLGSYLTKTYNLFDDSQYAKKIKKEFDTFYKTGRDPKGIFTQAIKELAESGSKSPRDDLAKLVRAEPNDAGIAGMFDSLLQNNASRQSVKSGRKRNEKLPPGIREVLGEVKDPFENYVKTYSNLSEIVGQQRYAQDVSEHLLNKGLARRKTAAEQAANPHFSADLTESQNSRMSMIFGKAGQEDIINPLEGLYTTPAYKKAIEEGLDVVAPAGELAKTFMRAKGATQLAKTVYSPTTHGRNVMGNGFLMLANGMLPGAKAGEAIKNIAPRGFVKSMLRKSNKELAERQARYVELGIANSGVGINIIRRNLSAFDSSPEKWLSQASVTAPLKKANKAVLDTYQAEDDFFKIAHFEKTLDYIKKSDKYKKLPLKEQEKIAAQRTRDLMPNYNLVPRNLKKLRGYPVGDFLSFPAEMVRVSKNLVKYTLDDITSGDVTLAVEGAKRAAGLTAVGMAPSMMSDFTRHLYNISDEQEDGINNIVSSWEYNQDRIYLSGIEEDERGNTVIDYLNLGPIDPFSYLKTAGQGLHTIIMSGMDPNSEMTRGELEKISLGTLEQAVGPFLAPSMITEALLDISKTDISKEPELIEFEKGTVPLTDIPYPKLKGQVGLILDPVIDVFSPAVIDLLSKRQAYEKSLEKNLGKFATKRGDAAFVEGEVDVPAAMGLKRQRLDITASGSFSIKPLLTEIDRAGAPVKELLREQTLGPNAIDSLKRRYRNAQKERLKGYEKLGSLLESYEALYGDRFEERLEKSLTKDGSLDITPSQQNHLSNSLYVDRETGRRVGYFEPVPFDETDINDFRRHDLPYEMFDDYYRSLMGGRIFNPKMEEEE